MSSTAPAAATTAEPAGSGQVPLKESDPELFALIEAERERQRSGLELIASENFTSRAVMEALGSCLTNKYSEGLPGHRYYGGNEVVDRVERLCQQRALAAFGLDAAEWGVNVQPYSGSSANFEAYTAMLRPGDRLMGLDLPSGGHLTHGYQTDKKKISATSIYFESRPYRVDAATGLLDYAGLEAIAAEFRPHLLVAGASAYPRDWDYRRMRAVADAHGALLMADMAHISGIVAARLCADPFAHCDVVTTTTHKTLRGPRAGLIFFRRGRTVPQHPGETLEDRVNAAVFPACQGGPHENAIAAVATALHEVLQPEWRRYVQAVLANAAHLAAELVRRGHAVVTGGTDNHLVLWDVRPHGLTGSKLEKLFEAAAISVNKNAVFGDVSALSPGGVRLGLPSLTTRGFAIDDVTRVADFLHRGVQIALRIQTATGKQLKDFVAALPADAELQQLKADVEAFARTFPLPGL